MAQLNLDYS